LETVITKCMERDPALRYQRAGELADDLRRFLQGEPVRARRTSLRVLAARTARRHRAATLGVLGALVLAGALAVVGRAYRLEQGRHAFEAAQIALLLEHDAPKAGRLLDEAERRGVGSPELHLYRGLV